MSEEFEQSLRRAGLTQKQFRDIVETLSGCRVDARLTSKWVRRPFVSVTAVALAELLARIPPIERDRLLTKE